MQIELLKRKYISVRGKVLEFPAGSIVDVGRQVALKWIEAGDAISQESERKAVSKPKKPATEKTVSAASEQGTARVRLLAIKHISVGGKLRAFHPGDWVRVGRQTARVWIAAGQLGAARPPAHFWQVRAPRDTGDHRTLPAIAGS